MKRITSWVGILLFSSTLGAYDFNPGDFLVRGVLGSSVNVVHADGTPDAGMVLGLEAEYMLAPKVSLTGAIRPVLSGGFIDLGFGIGAKYRWTREVLPFIPYVSVAMTPAFLIPTHAGQSMHFNWGLRPTAGCDYFVMRDLAVGLELALEPSYLFGSSGKNLEVSVDALLGITWRF